MLKVKKHKNEDKLDPLYVIFEQHLFNFQDSNIDRKALIGNIVNDYLSLLRRQNISIPPAMEAHVIEELGHQVNVMLVKKIYGCLTIDDYRKGVPPKNRRRARRRYNRLQTKAS